VTKSKKKRNEKDKKDNRNCQRDTPKRSFELTQNENVIAKESKGPKICEIVTLAL
jgi:hypothetical protein